MAVSLPMCTLDESGMGKQRARYARIARSVTSLDRRADSIRLSLSADFDQRTLDELMTVEAQCCPFFRFALNEAGTELTVSVDDAEMHPALDAIASELGAGLQATR
jgi:hypothetical protein